MHTSTIEIEVPAAENLTVTDDMLKTVEAILEPSGEVRLLKPVHVSRPSRVLLTLLEKPIEPKRGSTAALLQRLRDNPLPTECRRSADETDAQIEQERNAWE